MRGSSVLRFVDQCVGTLCIQVLRLVRKKKTRPLNPTSFGVIKCAGIGDAVLLIPLVEALQKKGRVVFFTATPTDTVAPYLSCEVVTINLKRPLEARKALRTAQVDMLYDLESWAKSTALLAWSSGAYTIGFYTKGQGKHYLFQETIEHKTDRHEQENFIRILDIVPVPSIVRQNPHSRTVLCHLFPGGSQAHLKMWPVRYWKILIDMLEKKGFDVAFTGSASDRKALVEHFGTGDHILAGQYTLAEMKPIIEGAACVISVDTGFMHLASYLGTPTVVLHGPTSPKRWGGRGASVYPIANNANPCISFGFESRCLEPHCMQKITPKDVLNVVEKAVGAYTLST